MRENRVFDVGVIGEGELTMLDLCEVAGSRMELEEVRGIVYRDSRGNAVKTAGREFIEDIDGLPVPDYSVFDSVKLAGGMESYPLITSRGCPYSCVFCAASVLGGRRWRPREPENLIEEIKQAEKRYGIKEFSVMDDNFTLDPRRAEEFCRRLISSGQSMRWFCLNGVRADRVDRSLLRSMKASGCSTLSFGIECGDPDVFGNIRKGESLLDIAEAVKLSKEEGLSVHGFFIVGLPGSTFESELKSIEFARYLKLDSCQFNMIVPYPGTLLWSWVIDNARTITHYTEGNHFFPPKVVFDTHDFPEHLRLKAYYTANVRLREWWMVSDPSYSGLRLKIKKAILLWKYDRRDLISVKLHPFIYSGVY